MRNITSKSGMSIIGILLSVLIAATVTVISVTSYQNVRLAAERTKAQEFVVKINQAIGAYELSGGTIADQDTAAVVLGKLKQKLSAEYKRLTVSVGEMASRDINLISMGEANDRPVIVLVNRRFEYRESGTGFKIEVGETTDESTAEIAINGLTYNPNETGWIWAESGIAAPSVITGVNKELLPPTFAYSGQVTMSEFPLLDIMIYPANPSGTTYHYTVDGSAPTASSPQWPNPTLTIAGLPPAFRVIAVHPDPLWADSPIAQTTIFAQLEIEYLREDGSDNAWFVFGEVTGGTNRIILQVPGVSVSNYDIYYTSDGTTPTEASAPYLGPYHFPAIWWPKEGRLLKAKAFSNVGGMVVDSSVFERVLMPSPVRLPTPEFAIDPAGGAVPTGTILNITNTLLPYSDIKSAYEDDFPTSTSTHDHTIPVAPQ